MGAAAKLHNDYLSDQVFSITSNIIDIAKYLEPITLKYRREFHSIPELGWEEEKTLALLETTLLKLINNSDLNFEVVHKTGGIWIDLTIDPELPRVLFRSDIDGLPIEENTNLPYSSKHVGKMHACGHDCHIAMLLSAFQAIAEGYITPQINLRFVWQRAEEYAQMRSGGERLVEEGVCANIKHAYGLHISSIKEAGVFFSKPAAFLANTVLIKSEIECSGGHVMSPNLGSNAIDIMTNILNTLRGFEKLVFDPEEPITFVPSIAKAGIGTNIRPNSAQMCFALRNFLPPSEKNRFIKAIREKINTIIKGYPTANVSLFEVSEGYPVLVNQPKNYTFVKNTLTQAGFQTEQSNRVFAGEDFAYYLKEVPGSFWCLGAKQGAGWDHHTPKFNPDERYLWQGVAFWLHLSQFQDL